jgi:hypothetical protein
MRTSHGQGATHFLVIGRRVVCGRCMNRHGLADALVRMGTRAGIAACSGCGAGGLPSWPPSWPRPKREREHLIDNA